MRYILAVNQRQALLKWKTHTSHSVQQAQALVVFARSLEALHRQWTKARMLRTLARWRRGANVAKRRLITVRRCLVRKEAVLCAHAIAGWRTFVGLTRQYVWMVGRAQVELFARSLGALHRQWTKNMMLRRLARWQRAAKVATYTCIVMCRWSARKKTVQYTLALGVWKTFTHLCRQQQHGSTSLARALSRLHRTRLNRPFWIWARFSVIDPNRTKHEMLKRCLRTRFSRMRNRGFFTWRHQSRVRVQQASVALKESECVQLLAMTKGLEKEANESRQHSETTAAERDCLQKQLAQQTELCAGYKNALLEGETQWKVRADGRVAPAQL
jgi:hypothetical protein